MAIETSPIYDLLISELGNPILSTATDCSYAAVLKAAGHAHKSEPVEAPVKAPAMLTPRSAPKPLASVAAKNAG